MQKQMDSTNSTISTLLLVDLHFQLQGQKGKMALEILEISKKEILENKQMALQVNLSRRL